MTTFLKSLGKKMNLEQRRGYLSRIRATETAAPKESFVYYNIDEDDMIPWLLVYENGVYKGSHSLDYDGEPTAKSVRWRFGKDGLPKKYADAIVAAGEGTKHAIGDLDKVKAKAIKKYLKDVQETAANTAWAHVPAKEKALIDKYFKAGNQDAILKLADNTKTSKAGRDYAQATLEEMGDED